MIHCMYILCVEAKIRNQSNQLRQQTTRKLTEVVGRLNSKIDLAQTQRQLKAQKKRWSVTAYS